MANEVDITPYTVPKVANAVLSDAKISFIYGWRDGGKSTSAFNTLIWKCLIDSHFRFAHCRAKYNELAGSTFQTLKDCIRDMCLEDYFIIKNDRFQIINKVKPNNYFFGASADQPDKIRSTANLNGFIVDEAHDLTESDFSSLIGTLRENKKLNTPTKAIFIFNNDKVKKNSFIATTFFNPKSPMYNTVDRTMVSYLDNPFIDKEKTKEKLMQVCLNDSSKFDYLNSGAFMEEKIDNPFFYAYDYDCYVDRRYKVVGGEQWVLSFDFNKNPCTLIVGCKVDDIYCIVDVILSGDNLGDMTPLQYCCNVFENKYIATNIVNRYMVMVTGDASGKSGTADVKANHNFYTSIRTYLGLNKNQISVRGANMTHKESREQCNIFMYKKKLLIFQSAAALVRDIEQAYYINDSLNDAKKEYGLHIVDALRYWIDCIMQHKRWQEYANYI